MEATEIVTRLLHGSHNIDRMKEEIEEVVRMVVGYALTEHRSPSPNQIRETFKSPECEWIVNAHIGVGLRSMVVECHLVESYGLTSAYSTDNSNFLSTERAQRVHKCLPVFVAGMIKHFPEIESAWKPLIDASFVSL